MVLQHAVSLTRVGEDPGGGLVLVERRTRGSGGELLKEGSHRASVELPAFGGLYRPAVQVRAARQPSTHRVLGRAARLLQPVLNNFVVNSL